MGQDSVFDQVAGIDKVVLVVIETFLGVPKKHDLAHPVENSEHEEAKWIEHRDAASIHDADEDDGYYLGLDYADAELFSEIELVQRCLVGLLRIYFGIVFVVFERV